MSDEAARREAIDPSRSFLVQAPAGSGKTTLLVQRYLALLAQASVPEEIVALTFTRKAAEEMRVRVLAAVSGASEPGAGDSPTHALACKAAQRATERGWRLDEHPERLRIMTFDALCAQLVNENPVATASGGGLQVTETGAPLYEKAALAVLAAWEDDPELAQALAILMPVLGNNVDRFVTLVVDLLARREQWLALLVARSADTPARVRAGLEAALAAEAFALMRRARAACPDAVLARACAYAEACTGDDWPLASLHAEDAGGLARWQELVALLLTKEGAVRKRFVKWLEGLGEAEAFDEGLAAYPAFVQALCDLRNWALSYHDAQWERLAALVRILPFAAAKLLTVFEAEGVWDFTEVALRALQALGSEEAPSDTALRLDRVVHHLLVDEFQDTSLLQYRLLVLLTAGWVPGEARSVFVVGDPMQSIYAFRKAEVGLFFRLGQEGLGDWPLHTLTLTRNFRSGPALVAWVNDAFARVLPGHLAPEEGAVPHVRAEAAQDAGGAVHVHPLGDVDLASEARYVAEWVARERAREPSARIAVLVRSRTHAHAIAQAFTQAGLRYSGVNLYQLAQRPLIRDLLSLTEALVFPGARFSLLACLRAPWVGLTLTDIALLCEGETRALALLIEDEAWCARLSPDGQARLAHFRSVWRAAQATRARVPLGRRVEEAWLALGGPAALTGAMDWGESEAFFTTLAECEHAGEVDLWAFRERLEAAYAPADPTAQDLQILTIHKAKGLEFDIVLCPGLGRATKPDTKPLLLALETVASPRQDFLLAPLAAEDEGHDALYEQLWALKARKRSHETARLLYVACTRARSTLHLIGHCRLNEQGLPQPAGLLKTLWPVVAEAFAEDVKAASEGATTAPSGPRRLARAALAQATGGSVTLSAQAPGLVPGDVVFDWAGVGIRIVGEVVHALLAELADRPLPRPAEALPAEWDARLVHLLRAQALPEAEREAPAARVREALMAMLADPRGRWILADHREARSEYALTAVLGESARNVRVDRTFVDEAGVRWIIDYKVSRHEGGSREAFLDRECERYTPQLTAYGQAFRAFDARPIRLALYFPLLAVMRDWPYEAGGDA